MEVRMPINGVNTTPGAAVERIKQQEQQQAADKAQRDMKARDAADREQEASRNKGTGGAVDVKA
jgi:hypothetical protein